MLLVYTFYYNDQFYNIQYIQVIELLFINNEEEQLPVFSAVDDKETDSQMRFNVSVASGTDL